MALFGSQSAHQQLLSTCVVALRALNHRLNRSAAGAGQGPRDPELAAILDPAATKPPTWDNYYEAEQRLVMLMDDDDLRADHARRLTQATALGVISATALAETFRTAPTTAARAAANIALLSDLQYSYQRRTLNREERRKKANTLNWIGIVMVCVTVAVLVACYLTEQIRIMAEYHLLVVLWFGAIGAFLSRIISFQSALNTLDYDSLIRDYSGWSMVLRLIVGTFGALVGYFLIRGELVGGELFPGDGSEGFFQYMKALRPDQALAEVAVTASPAPVGPGAGRTISLADNVGLKSSPLAVIAISTDFAKMLVWATIAGFSERLIPDRLSAIEASGKAGVKPN